MSSQGAETHESSLSMSEATQQASRRANLDLVAGIDVGSSSTKCVLVDSAGDVAGAGAVRTLPGFQAVAEAALETALADGRARRSPCNEPFGTGEGRSRSPT
jgi:activator of 2-hydroxyglutaryl-CoA dehydratase